MADNGATNEFTIMDPDGIQIVIRTKWFNVLNIKGKVEFLLFYSKTFTLFSDFVWLTWQELDCYFLNVWLNLLQLQWIEWAIPKRRPRLARRENGLNINSQQHILKIYTGSITVLYKLHIIPLISIGRWSCEIQIGKTSIILEVIKVYWNLRSYLQLVGHLGHL